MTEQRFIMIQNGNFHTVRDTVEKKPLGMFEFKDNQFPVYACFHGIIDLLNELNDENERLKRNYNSLSHNNGLLHDECTNKINALKKENEQLKQRNNRQAKQLDRLYNLIEEKDWRALNDIIDDFKRCEEQLQREWKCYE